MSRDGLRTGSPGFDFWPGVGIFRRKQKMQEFASLRRNVCLFVRTHLAVLDMKHADGQTVQDLLVAFFFVQIV
jgi:hypothetical protein